MGGRIRSIVAALAWALLAAAARAADPPAQSPQEAADEAVVRGVMQSTGYDQIAAHRADLEAVLAHAPASYPLVERRGDVVIMHDDGQNQAAVLAQLLTAAADKRNTSVVRRFNTYPMAALLLGALANENRQPQVAMTYLDRGLKLQPDNSHLVSEKAAALYPQKRFGEALALASAWLDANPLGGDENRARLLRSKGLSLTELGRLDEAEAAYKESLVLQPGHKGAQGELEYIAKLRATGRREAIGIVTSDKARDVGRAAIKAPDAPEAPPKP